MFCEKGQYALFDTPVLACLWRVIGVPWACQKDETPHQATEKTPCHILIFKRFKILIRHAWEYDTPFQKKNGHKNY